MEKTEANKILKEKLETAEKILVGIGSEWKIKEGAEEEHPLHAAEKLKKFLEGKDYYMITSLADEDAAVFNSFMSCYKLPKATDEEKAARTAAIRAAAKQAATVPLNIARSSFVVLKLADRLVVSGNPGVITDGACSGLLARAALRCAEYNVRINLGLTKDEVWNEQAAAELKQLLADAEALETRLLAVTDKALQ